MGGISTAGERYSIHDVVIDDIDPVRYKGYGVLFQLSSFQPQLKDVKIDHITGFSPKVLFNVGVLSPNPKIANFVFTNNLIAAGEREVTSTGGGPNNCAYLPQRLGAANLFETCFTNPIVAHNVIPNALSSWPKDNYTPKNPADAGLRSVKTASLQDFRLCREKNEAIGCKKPSPFLHAGTDGKTVGADIDAIEAATAGSR
jgi:hypothetical protein